MLLIVDTALPLKAEDVERLIELKEKYYRVWKTIGRELGIDVDTLNAIEKDHTDDDDRLYAVIDSANPAPTREAMTKILESANITNAIAGMIMWHSLPPPPQSLIYCKGGMGSAHW